VRWAPRSQVGPPQDRVAARRCLGNDGASALTIHRRSREELQLVRNCGRTGWLPHVRPGRRSLASIEGLVQHPRGAPSQPSRSALFYLTNGCLVRSPPEPRSAMGSSCCLIGRHPKPVVNQGLEGKNGPKRGWLWDMQLPQNVVKDTFLPFYSGAVRYYRESTARYEISVFGSSRTAPETPNSRRDRIHSKSTILTTIRAPAFFLSPTAIAAIARAWLLARRATARRHPTRLLGLLSGTAWPVSFLGPCVHPRSRIDPLRGAVVEWRRRGCLPIGARSRSARRGSELPFGS
jgi:hypothetical protein